MDEWYMYWMYTTESGRWRWAISVHVLHWYICEQWDNRSGTDNTLQYQEHIDQHAEISQQMEEIQKHMEGWQGVEFLLFYPFIFILLIDFTQVLCFKKEFHGLPTLIMKFYPHE